MRKNILFLVSIIFSFNFASLAQETQKATSVNIVTTVTKVSSIASRSNLEPAPKSIGIAKDKKSGKNIAVYGKGFPTGNDPLVINNQLDQRTIASAPSLIFDAAISDSTPSDPDTAVGPNHCVVVYNTAFRIFDKTGNPLTPALATSAIFPVDGCCDLTCIYDSAANRFVLTFLGSSVQVAVSQTENPVTGGWYVYDFPMSTDYQKLSVWSDGYYLTANKDSGSATTSEVIHALERSKMLTGDSTAKIIGFPLPGITTSGFFSPQAFNVTSANFPAAGNVPIVYMQDDSWAGVTQDHIKLWKVNVNWNTPTLSTISSPETIVTAPFNSVFDNGSFVNLPQPNGGTLVDALQATIMNQAQFRKFPTYNSAVFNFVVDVDGSETKLAGIRWYEMRQAGDGLPWTIYQEGTYTSPFGKHAWNASMGIDNQGNIGMGYTGMGGTNNQFLSSYYTGRYANDPLGIMTVSENLIKQGSGNIQSTRYGDYGKVAIDPSDDKSFWFINELFANTRKDVIGVFKIAPNFNTDIGVTNITNPITSTLSANENITISIFNYGNNPITNFPVSYQINGGNTITETFTGTIASTATATYTFVTSANLSILGQVYSIIAKTNLVGDQFIANNSFTKTVTHLIPKDIGISAIISPVSGSELTANESINVVLTNYGGQSQTNFNVNFNLNGTVYTSFYSGILAPNTSVNYTYAQSANFSTTGSYTLTCYTNLPLDGNTNNDVTTATILKTNCQSVQNCNLGDVIKLFQLGTINNISECGLNGYSDFTSLTTDLPTGSTNNLTIKTGYGNQHLAVWIDYNNDFVFTNNEKVISDFIIAPGQQAGDFTASTSFPIPAGVPIGEHLLRARTNYQEIVPDNPCQDTQYGEVEDYKVFITNTLSKEEFTSKNTEFKVLSGNDKQFQLILDTKEITDSLIVTVYDISGKRLVYHRVQNKNGRFTYDLDMSYAASGIYLVRIGNNNFGKIKKIIVK